MHLLKGMSKKRHPHAHSPGNLKELKCYIHFLFVMTVISAFFEIFLYFYIKVLYNNNIFSITMKGFFHILGGSNEMPKM